MIILNHCEISWLLRKIVWQFLRKLNIDLPYDPAVPLLGTNPKELKADTQKNASRPRFTEALCTIAKRWKQVFINR